MFWLVGSMAACGPKTVATAATISDQFSKALVIAQSGVIDAKASGVISAAVRPSRDLSTSRRLRLLISISGFTAWELDLI